jgi:leucyl aminopeptidase
MKAPGADMSEPQDSVAVDLVDLPGGDVTADVLALPLCENQPVGLPGLDEASGGEIGRALGTGEFQGKPYQILLTPLSGSRWAARRVMLVGAGPADAYNLDRARRVATTAARAVRERRGRSVAFVPLPGGLADTSTRTAEETVRLLQAVTEGLMLAEFDVAQYKTDEQVLSALERITLAVPDRSVPGLGDAVRRGRILGRCSNLARALANEPGNRLPPRVFAERAGQALSGAALTVEILDERRIVELGMRLLAGVGQGSKEPPRLLVIRYDPPDAPAAPVLGLVGKGITFDAGGISIKPSQGMDRMKDDMSGGAAVVAAMRAIAELGAPVRVLGLVPSAENMPGGGAIRPGDILTAASGTTVEVLDTDAEGRLVLGDALWYARHLGATHLVDVATLTGACSVALGNAASGLFARPDTWMDLVRRVADRAGDRVWPLPLFEEYREQLKSDIADLANVGGRPAGAATAAMFLKEFVGDVPWAHLDIAGTAWNEDAKPYMPKGPTGVGVRTLAELAFEDLASRKDGDAA